MDTVKSSTVLSGEALDELHRTYMGAPFNQLLGIEFGEYHDDGGVTLQLPLDDRHQNGTGVIHGGVMLTLADAAVSYGIARAVGGRCTTVEIKINYPFALGKGRSQAGCCPRGGPLRGQAGGRSPHYLCGFGLAIPAERALPAGQYNVGRDSRSRRRVSTRHRTVSRAVGLGRG